MNVHNVPESDLEIRFNHHEADVLTIKGMNELRRHCKNIAYQLHIIPDGREKNIAMTKLEEVMFWGNAAIAREAAK